MANKKYLLDQFLVAFRAAPPDRSPMAYAAEVIGCDDQTARRYYLELFDPKQFAKHLEKQRDWGFKYRGTEPHRKPPTSPTPAAIAVALKITNGNAYAAARLLDCSKTPVRNWIESERAAGRPCGNVRVITSSTIEHVITSKTPSRPVSQDDLELAARISAYMEDA